MCDSRISTIGTIENNTFHYVRNIENELLQVFFDGFLMSTDGTTQDVRV